MTRFTSHVKGSVMLLADLAVVATAAVTVATVRAATKMMSPGGPVTPTPAPAPARHPHADAPPHHINPRQVSSYRHRYTRRPAGRAHGSAARPPSVRRTPLPGR
jgi:hypothetical protein